MTDQHQRLEVPVTTLDALAARIVGSLHPVSVLKIDVEDHGDAMLEGGPKTLRRFQPALLIEVEGRHRARPVDERFKRLRALGDVGRWLESWRDWCPSRALI